MVGVREGQWKTNISTQPGQTFSLRGEHNLLASASSPLSPGGLPMPHQALTVGELEQAGGPWAAHVVLQENPPHNETRVW